jgi:hypothetical protein
VQIDGMNVGSAFNGGGVAGLRLRHPGAAEVQVTVAGGPRRGRPRRALPFNLVPKTGGNTFAGTYFGNIAGEWSQSDNVDDDCAAFGIPNPRRSSGAGTRASRWAGPIKRDKVWFYGTARTFGSYTDIAGRFANANAGNPLRGTTWSIRASRSARRPAGGSAASA